MLLHQTNAAFAFTLLESLSVWGWKMTVRTYRTLMYCFAVFLAFLLCLSSSVAFELLEKTQEFTAIDPKNRILIAALFFVVPISYMGVAAAARESLSSRRLTVVYSPQRQLFKALDIPLTAVYIARCLPRLVLLAISYATLLIGFLRSWSGYLIRYPELLGVVITTPILFLLFLAYITSHNATALPRRTQKNRWLLLLLAVLTGTTAYQLSYWLNEIINGSIALEELGLLDFILRVLPTVFALILLATILLLFLTINNIRRMPHIDFGIQELLKIQKKRAHTDVIHTSSRWLGVAIMRTLVCHPSFTLVMRFFALTFLLAATASGAVLGGFTGLAAIPFANLALLLAYIAALALSEHIGKIIGFLATIPRLRFCYERGISHYRLAGIGLGVEIIINSIMLLPCFCAVQLVLGGYTALHLLLLPLAIISATTVAAALTIGNQRQPDGTGADYAIVAVIMVLLSGPVVALLIASSPFFLTAALLWTLLLLGGAFLCLCKRIQNIPCYL